ncbi:MAG: DUF951 domain-containing protein [Chloroflexota bacterium]
MEIKVGDRVKLKKSHPCGSDIWAIYRVGADIGLRCAGCGRRVMLTRSEFNRRLKQHLPQQETKELEN